MWYLPPCLWVFKQHVSCNKQLLPRKLTHQIMSLIIPSWFYPTCLASISRIRYKKWDEQKLDLIRRPNGTLLQSNRARVPRNDKTWAHDLIKLERSTQRRTKTILIFGRCLSKTRANWFIPYSKGWRPSSWRTIIGDNFKRAGAGSKRLLCKADAEFRCDTITLFPRAFILVSCPGDFIARLDWKWRRNFKCW